MIKGVNISSENKAKTKNIRVFVADDHKPMLDRIVKLLTPHFEIVGTAADGKTAQEMIERLKPEIAVLDISMPFKTGIEIAADLKTNGQEVKIVIITTHDDETFMRAAFSAGALAYVIKTRMGDELHPALESAYAGKMYISSDAKMTGDLKEFRS
jgi:DNA-binding NarL/FixJ family response regulator